MAAAAAQTQTRLVPDASQTCRSILLNGKARSSASNGSVSPSLSSGISSSDEGSQPPTPAKLTFATPLPSSGKRRANSITLGVAARASMLNAQNGSPGPRTAPLPVVNSSSPWYQTGATPPDVYTVQDAKAGVKKAWSKIKRRRSSSRDSKASTSPSIPEEPLPPAAEVAEESATGDATPRRRHSPPSTPAASTVSHDELGPLLRRASADPRRPTHSTEHDTAVYGFDSSKEQAPLERTHDHTSEYVSELWRSPPGADDASSTTSGDESRDSRSQVSEDDEDDEDVPLDEVRKTSTAASIEVVERQRAHAR